MIKQAPTGLRGRRRPGARYAAGSRYRQRHRGGGTGSGAAQSPAAIAHAESTRACPRRPAASGRRQHLDAARLRLRPQPGLRPGAYRHRADDRRRRVRAVRGQRLRRLRVLLRPLQLHPQRADRRRGELAPRKGPRVRPPSIRARRRQRLRLARGLRGAQQRRLGGLRPLQPDRQQRRQLASRDDELGRVRGGDARRRHRTENGIFQRMAVQGQSVIAAAGDAGSEDCYSAQTVQSRTQTQLAVDDPEVAARCRECRGDDAADRVRFLPDRLERLPGHGRLLTQRPERGHGWRVLARVAGQSGPAGCDGPEHHALRAQRLPGRARLLVSVGSDGGRRRRLLERTLARLRLRFEVSPPPPTPRSSSTSTRAASTSSAGSAQRSMQHNRATPAPSPTSRRATMTSRSPTWGVPGRRELRPGQRPRHARRSQPGSGPAGRGRMPVRGQPQPQYGSDRRGGCHAILGGGFGSVTSVTFGGGRAGSRCGAVGRDDHRRPARHRPPNASTSPSPTHPGCLGAVHRRPLRLRGRPQLR